MQGSRRKPGPAEPAAAEPSRFGGFNLSAVRAAASDALNRAATSDTWERASRAASELSARAAAAKTAAKERLARDTATGGGGPVLPTSQPPLTPAQSEAAFSNLLSQATVPLEALRRLCFIDGVPDGVASTPRLRALAWKLLLGYLPPDRAEWPSHLRSQRALYAAWRQELTIDPRRPPDDAAAVGGEAMCLASGASQPLEEAGLDHPLADQTGSAWREWHADEDLRSEIQKDVDRTMPEYMFFSREQPTGRTHAATIARVLFVYAKLNPGIRYVQGMNELVAPIFYAFCAEIESDSSLRDAVAAFTDGAGQEGYEGGGAGGAGCPLPSVASECCPSAADLCGGRAAMEAAEADSFFCFTALMSEVRDHFCSKLDHTALGITARIGRFEGLLRSKDAQLASVLHRLGVAPTFYAFRWISLLMTQELDLPDVLRLWDSLLADSRRFDLLLYVCVSVVLSLRAPLLSAPDFSTAIKALQRPDAWPPLHALLVSALALYQRDHAPKEHGKENDEADLVLGEMMGHAREAYPGGRGGGEPGGAEPAGGVAGESDGDRAGAMSGEGGLGRRK